MIIKYFQNFNFEVHETRLNAYNNDTCVSDLGEEEVSWCIRLTPAGYMVIQYHSVPVHHLPHQKPYNYSV
jgi:hypothetical protein